jgi:ribonucleotide monophosphatase NagD (HAD superfamily)
MHDGITTYEGVLDVVQKLKEQGKDLVILSNSSKRQENSIKMLKKLKFDPERDFSQIITSGEVAYQLLTKTLPDASPLAPQPWSALEPIWEKKEGAKLVFCFGSGDGDEEYLKSCGWTLSSIEEADLIVARGTFTIQDASTVIHKTHDSEEAYFKAYHEQLAKAAERKIPMIVANPDKVRPDADRSPMPGTIGNDYERALSQNGESSSNAMDMIKYIGKPFSDVYEIALRGKDRSRVCMIGDALETDVTGGSAAGIDTIWVVNDGIHNFEIQSKGNRSLQEGCSKILAEFNEIPETYAKGRRLTPSIVLPHFRW